MAVAGLLLVLLVCSWPMARLLAVLGSPYSGRGCACMRALRAYVSALGRRRERGNRDECACVRVRRGRWGRPPLCCPGSLCVLVHAAGARVAGPACAGADRPVQAGRPAGRRRTGRTRADEGRDRHTGRRQAKGD